MKFYAEDSYTDYSQVLISVDKWNIFYGNKIIPSINIKIYIPTTTFKIMLLTIIQINPGESKIFGSAKIDLLD